MFAEAILARKTDAGLRRFDMRRDLRQLAELIDLAFGSEIEAARSSIVAEMRRLAASGPLLWLANASYATLSPLLGGFVWINDGRLVGNVTLSADHGPRGPWTITNVAVHPDFRRQGIARQLMEAALDEARDRRAPSVVLEVQAANAPAQQLYRELGFEHYQTVTELRLPAPNASILRHPPALFDTAPTGAPALRKRRPGDWRRLYDFYQAVTTAPVQAVRPVLPEDYQLGIRLRLNRWLDDVMYRCERSEWILEQGGIRAVLQVTGQYADAAHRLQIEVRPECQGTGERELLAAGLQRLTRFPERDVVSTVAASQPQALEAFRRAGFRTMRVLDQLVFRYSRPAQQAATARAERTT